MTDLISRADAIEIVLTYFIPRSHTGERGEHEEDFVRTIFKALPSAEAEPTVIRSRTLMPTKDFKEWAKRIREVNPNAVVIPCDAEVVSADAVQGDECDHRGHYGYFYRPCVVKAKKSGRKEERQDRKAKFHRWADLSKGVQQVVALVEFEDGHVEQVQPDRVIFKEE